MDLVQSLCKTTGVGRNTISKTISEYKNKNVLKSPNKTKIRASIFEKIDNFEKNAVQRNVHDFWFKRHIPTLEKILTSIHEDPDLLIIFSNNILPFVKKIKF